MQLPFEQDQFPGKPKMLFIGIGNSSHTHSWIELLSRSELNIQLFAIPGTQPPQEWNVKTYISGIRGKNNPLRQYLYKESDNLFKSTIYKAITKLGLPQLSPENWLAATIKKWQPDIIHTLGLFDNQGGLFYLQTREKYHLESYGKWVLQLRGGSDMALRYKNPEFQDIIKQALFKCDQIICDNYKNIEIATEMGVSKEKFAPFVPVPGTGGMDLSDIIHSKFIAPSKRERIIIWPKAYECVWSKGVSVLAGIQLAWKKIYPCEIYLLAISPEINEWIFTLPKEIQEHFHIFDRIPRKEVLSLLRRSRVMLAPSLVDGVPNSLYEAMAYGAFPIVSPLETITPIVRLIENVLFARNLFPNEICDALILAMTDDELVDKAAENNLELATRLVDRESIRMRVVKFYEEFAINGKG